MAADERSVFLGQMILLHECGIIVAAILHVGAQQTEQGKPQHLLLGVRIHGLRKKQHHVLVLPGGFNVILRVEPCAVKPLIHIAILPCCPGQFRPDVIHLVEDKEHMQLGVALEVLLYSVLYHVF